MGAGKLNNLYGGIFLVFSSVVFLFFFLPLVLVSHYIIPKSKMWIKNLLLLIFSLIFYYWGEHNAIFIMVACILINYSAGILLTRNIDSDALLNPGEHTFSQKCTLIISVTLSLGLLIYYKYTNFAVVNWNVLSNYFNMPNLTIKEFKTILLPLGISFYTFHALSYTFDIYYGKLKVERNIINFAGYVVMFPQLVAGPIVRYRDIWKQFAYRTTTKIGFVNGIQRFIIGLAKKVLIANTVAKAADGIFAIPSDQLSCTLAWIGVISYSLQIYFDFSGYSDMAIGLGMMLGFRYKENFNYPYVSQSIQEFWRRWHISLSSWLRDYVYIPLGGSRKGILRTYINIIIVFFFCGLWHGANWTFIVWGLWYGFFLVLERLGLRTLLDQTGRFIRHLYVILVVLIGWVFFRSDTMIIALRYIGTMFGMDNSNGPERLISEFIQIDVIIAIIIGCIASINIPKIVNKIITLKAKQQPRRKHTIFTIYKSIIMLLTLLLFVMSIMSLANGYYNPFIYFRF
jgi:alginate O-acetyltransferase complex protein AlgI